ncbi:MAG: MetQ/NlpA family ABC transporter substrate-binding protein [Anaeromassilibacillus sp.]
MDESAGLNATVKDITSNPKNIQITESEAALCPHPAGRRSRCDQR